VTIHGAPVNLTPLEYQLLLKLVHHAGGVVPSSVLLESVWGDAYGATTNYLKVFINRLRSKLGHAEDAPAIETERRVAYRLVCARGVWHQPRNEVRYDAHRNRVAPNELQIADLYRADQAIPATAQPIVNNAETP